MKLNDNIAFKIGLYNIGDFFIKYHNGLMFNNDFDKSEITREIKELIESVRTIQESIEE